MDCDVGVRTMGFMSEISEDIGWNNCIEYLLKHLDEFQESLTGGQYDYFPYEEIEDKLKKLKRKLDF